MARKRAPASDLEGAVERVLKAFYAFEDQVRALPADRRAGAIRFAVERLRRLRPGKSPTLQPPDARQLDLPHG